MKKLLLIFLTLFALSQAAKAYDEISSSDIKGTSGFMMFSKKPASNVEYWFKANNNSGVAINTSQTNTGKNSGVVSVANPDNLEIAKIEILTSDPEKFQMQMGNKPGKRCNTDASETKGSTSNGVLAGDDMIDVSGTNISGGISFTPSGSVKYFYLKTTGSASFSSLKIYYKDKTPAGDPDYVATPTWNVTEAHPGDVIRAECATPGSTVYIQDDVNQGIYIAQGEAGAACIEYTVKDSDLNNTLHAFATYTTSDGTELRSEAKALVITQRPEVILPDTAIDELDLNSTKITTSYDLKKITTYNEKALLATYYIKGYNNSGIQINTGAEETKTAHKSGLINADVPAGMIIDKIELTTSSDKFVVEMSNTAGSYTGTIGGSGSAVKIVPPSDGVTITGVKNNGVYTYTPNDGKEYQYFALTTSGSAAFSDIKIYYRKSDPNYIYAPTATVDGAPLANNGSYNVDKELVLSSKDTDAEIVYSLSRGGESVCESKVYDAPLKLGFGNYSLSFSARKGEYVSSTIELNFEVKRLDKAIAFSNPATNGTMGIDYTSTSIADDGTGRKISYTSSNPAVASVDAETGVVTLVAAGTTTITATAETNDTYNEATAQYNLTVVRQDPTFSFTAANAQVTLGEAFTAPALDGAEGFEIKYESSKPTVAKVDPATGAVEILAAGTTEISATSTATTIYNPHTAKYLLKVSDPNQTEYYIEFKANGSDDGTNIGSNSTALANQIEKDEDKVVKSLSGTNLYAGQSGLKMGASSTGSLTVTLNQKYNVSEIVLTVSKFNKDDSGVKVGNAEAVKVEADNQEIEFTLDGSAIESFTIESTTKRVYLKGIKLICANGQVIETSVATPVLTVNGEEVVDDGEYLTTDKFELSCSTPDAVMKYTYREYDEDADELEVFKYDAPFSLAENIYYITYWAEKEGFKASEKKTTLIYVEEPSTKVATPKVYLNDELVADDFTMTVLDELTFSCSTPNAKIKYTITLMEDEDGEDGEEKVYTEPLTFPADMYTLKLHAEADGLENSDEVTFDFLVDKLKPEFTFEVEDLTVYLEDGSNIDMPKINGPEGLIYTYESDEPDAAEIKEDGTIFLWKVCDDVVITATSKETDIYESGKAEFRLDIEESRPKKVTYGMTFDFENKHDEAGYKELVNNNAFPDEGSKIKEGVVTLTTVGHSRIYNYTSNGKNIYELRSSKATGDEEPYNPVNGFTLSVPDGLVITRVQILRGGSGTGDASKWEFSASDNKLNVVSDATDNNSLLWEGHVDAVKVLNTRNNTNSISAIIVHVEGDHIPTPTMTHTDGEWTVVYTAKGGHKLHIIEEAWKVDDNGKWELLSTNAATDSAPEAKAPYRVRSFVDANESLPIDLSSSWTNPVTDNDGNPVDTYTVNLAEAKDQGATYVAVKAKSVSDAGLHSEEMAHTFDAEAGTFDTGIGAINPDAAKTDAIYFNLQGQRVARPLHGQIYIRVVGGRSEKIAY